jgi:hypothetical protein
MKLASCCLGLLLCAVPRQALAQTPNKSGATSEPPSPLAVPAAPQSTFPASLSGPRGNSSPPGVSAAPLSTDADPTQPPRAVPARLSAFEPQGRVWYGWQTLATDLAAVSIAYLALSEQQPVASSPASAPEDRSGPSAASLLAGLGAATFVLGAPAIHLVHGRPDSAAISLGLRLGLPVVGGLAGFGLAGGNCPATTDSDCAKNSPVLLIAVGAIVGLITASAIDASQLAYEKPKPKAGPIAQLGYSPVLSADRKQAGLRVFGTF